MVKDPKQAGQDRVRCELCMKEVARSDAAVSEMSDHVAYFCGADCYEKWRSQRYHEFGTSEPEVQLGHGRSKARDERMKEILRQHPQRDEPRLDSVEPDETPPP